MIVDDEVWFSPRPFWFVSPELLAGVLRAEIEAVTQVLARYPELPKLFDDPEATVPQRRACFSLLAHRRLMDLVYATFSERYEQSPSLGDAESDVIRRTHNVVLDDAPAWVLEMNQVIERLPSRIAGALPEPLRAGGFDSNNAVQMYAIESAKNALSTVEQIQTLIQGVLDQQLRRLEQRWGPITLMNQPAQTQLGKVPVGEANPPIGTDGLGQKIVDFSRYLEDSGLTDKQRLAFSLKFEYELGLIEIASRMRIHHSTADEHIKTAQKKINEVHSREKRLKARAKHGPEF